MDEPTIYRTLQTGYPEKVEVVDRCTYCKEDILKGQEIIKDFDDEVFCDVECATEQMLKDGALVKEVAE